MRGAYFKGWGYMRFWLTGAGYNAGGANHQFDGGDRTDGCGSAPTYPGAIESAHWREPFRSTLVSLGVSRNTLTLN